MCVLYSFRLFPLLPLSCFFLPFLPCPAPFLSTDGIDSFVRFTVPLFPSVLDIFAGSFVSLNLWLSFFLSFPLGSPTVFHPERSVIERPFSLRRPCPFLLVVTSRFSCCCSVYVVLSSCCFSSPRASFPFCDPSGGVHRFSVFGIPLQDNHQGSCSLYFRLFPE